MSCSLRRPSRASSNLKLYHSEGHVIGDVISFFGASVQKSKRIPFLISPKTTIILIKDPVSDCTTVYHTYTGHKRSAEKALWQIKSNQLDNIFPHWRTLKNFKYWESSPNPFKDHILLREGWYIDSQSRE